MATTEGRLTRNSPTKQEWLDVVVAWQTAQGEDPQGIAATADAGAAAVGRTMLDAVGGMPVMAAAMGVMAGGMVAGGGVTVEATVLTLAPALTLPAMDSVSVTRAEKAGVADLELIEKTSKKCYKLGV